MPLLNSIARLARSSAGREAARKAMRYAQSPEGKRKIADVRQRLASRGKPRR
jgi:hypothetical protein